MKDVNRGLFLLFVGMVASEIIELISGLNIGSFGTDVIAAVSVSSRALTKISLVVHLLLVIEMLFLSRIKQPRIIPLCIGALELLAGLVMFVFPVQFINAVIPPADIIDYTVRILRMTGLGVMIATVVAGVAGYFTAKKPVKFALVIMGVQLLVSTAIYPLSTLVLHLGPGSVLARGCFFPFATLFPVFSFGEARIKLLSFKHNVQSETQTSSSTSYLEAYKKQRKG